MASASDKAKFPPFQLLTEPALAFSPDDANARDIHPLRGLANFGPLSKHAIARFSPQLRVALVGPESGQKGVIGLMKLLQGRQQPNDRSGYVPAYLGFETIFGVPFHAAPPSARIVWPDRLEEFSFGGTPEEKLVTGFRDALSRLELVRDQFDIVVVHLPDAWRTALKRPQFDAHDALKAMGATYGIPTQVLNDRVFAYAKTYAANVAWRLSIALYVKAGGIPWKLAPISGVPDGTAYIGLAYALRSIGDETHFVTCCSQVFDMDGGGMQFVAFEARDPVTDVREAKRNPFLTRADMRAVLARSLAIYQKRNGGQLPKRLVVHKTTSFKPEELQGVCDATTSIGELECLEIGTRAAWRGIWMVTNPKWTGANPKKEPRSIADGYPVPRGILQVCSGTSCLVWVAGNVPGASSKGDYYQGGKSIPRPVMLTRHVGRGPFDLVALEALALTKMDWNNDALYDPAPVTIRYSQRLARTIANVPDLPKNTYPYRLFM